MGRFGLETYSTAAFILYYAVASSSAVCQSHPDPGPASNVECEWS